MRKTTIESSPDMKDNSLLRQLDNFLQDQSRCFTCATGLMTLLGLAAIWLPVFPPMQDFPQHLFMANVLAELDNPQLNWRDIFAADLKLGPYLLFYLIVGSTATILPVLAAGKIFLSLSFGLVTLWVWLWGKMRSEAGPPWALLMVFPLFFSQVYHLGFANYLISIPLLFLTLLLHEELAANRLRPLTILCYFLSLTLLFFSHPYTLLAYIGLGLVISLAGFRRALNAGRLMGIFTPLAVGALFVAWYAKVFGLSGHSGANPLEISWWPFGSVLDYFILPFTGFQISAGCDPVFVVLWAGIAALLAAAVFRRKAFVIQRPYGILFAITLLGYLALPFWVGEYSYFNLRLASICYVLLGITLSQVRFKAVQVYLLIALLGSVMVMTIHNHLKISAEVEELRPLLARMAQNANVYPVYADSASAAIDPHYFYQIHSHDHFYYHLLVGGGAPPELFPSKMNPIYFKDNPARQGHLFATEDYRYVLVRGILADKESREGFRLVAASQAWQLYGRLSAAE